MSTFLNQEKPKKLSTAFSFCKLGPVEKWNVEGVERAPHSNGAAPSATSTASLATANAETRNVERSEWCFITKSPSYVHQRAHWVSPVRKNKDLKEKIETFLQTELAIVPKGFDLNHVTNLTNLDPSLHLAMDKFAMFAVTCSLPTLNALIELITSENEKIQIAKDTMENYQRNVKFLHPPVSNALYDLVVLHPDHFLPQGSVLTCYPRSNGQITGTKQYAISPDGGLREMPAHNDSPRFPSFAFDAERRAEHRLNPFLVILSAEIKFRRYIRVSSRRPLPFYVEVLIQKTMELAELIYWQPTARPNTAGASFMTGNPSFRMHGDNDSGSSGSGQDADDAEMGLGAGKAKDDPLTTRPAKRSRKRPAAEAEAQREYWQHLLSGRDHNVDTDDEDLLQDLSGSYYGALNDGEIPPHPIARVQAWQEAILG